MPSGFASISRLPIRISSALSLIVRGVCASISHASQVSPMISATRAGSVTTSACSASNAACSGVNGVSAKGSLQDRRSMTPAKSGSGRASPRNVIAATGPSGPSGHSAVSTATPLSTAAIRASSRKHPKPIWICRSIGSVSGRPFAGSRQKATPSSPSSETIQGWRLCGFGASRAKLSACSRMSA